MQVLLRLVTEAKFGTAPNADVLLSPHVEALIDVLAKAVRTERPTAFDIDWSDPALMTSEDFIRAADAVRERHAYLQASIDARPDAGLEPFDLEALLAQAMKPYSIPVERLAPSDPTAITGAVLDRLEGLHLAASPGPWFVRQLDDTMCMSALAVSMRPDRGANESMRAGDWPGTEIVAATLVQDPPYVVPADDRYEENTKLIAECRTWLPELIRLARLSLNAEEVGDGPGV